MTHTMLRAKQDLRSMVWVCKTMNTLSSNLTRFFHYTVWITQYDLPVLDRVYPNNATIMMIVCCIYSQSPTRINSNSAVLNHIAQHASGCLYSLRILYSLTM